METAPASVGAESTKFISFDIGGQTFCIDIMSVREIRGWTPAMPMPHAPMFMRGVINLRGSVLPVVDLAVRLGFPMGEPNARSAVVVVDLPGQIVGFLVDAVSDILEVAPETVQPTPDVASAMAKDFVRGVVATGKGMISMLKTDKLAPSDGGGFDDGWM
jgi:purine-binding chemotaxis protein CheW